MNNRRTKLIFKIILGQFGVSLIIVAMALSILFYAEGYRLNTKNLKIIKTGVLALSTYPKEATVVINGKVASKKTPYSENLSSGYYDVEVYKDGYVAWVSYAKVEEEFVTNFKNVVLFKEDIQPRELSDQKMIDLLDSPVDTLAQKKNNGLSYSDFEIWSGDGLITRFSEPILQAEWYPDKQHVLYQQGNEIRVIEKDGSNDTLLVTLEDDNISNFFVDDKGDQLYFSTAGKYKVAKIR